ncbi:MAG TPA: DUF1697 domain-containing protein [Bryobacteraceae bacterium]|nr:DUF1697 domain-containing protein [Bryobacteraceae bacterium]
MAIYIAFLRAINVGGRVVKMDALREIFKGCGLRGVETFIASGNVIFEASTAKPLEGKIEKQLKSVLGYEVETFVRSAEEVRAVSLYQPFPAAAVEAARSLHVGFLRDALSPATAARVKEFDSDVDEFHVHGREVYWLCRVPQAETKVNPKKFERAIEGPATFRNRNTIARLAARYSR